jgi:hypothetical protein
MSIDSTPLSTTAPKRGHSMRAPKRPTGPPDLNVALAIRPKVAWKMLDCGVTRGYALLNAGEIDSFTCGRSRRITVESIRNYIARQVARTSKSKPASEAIPQRRGRGRPRKIIAEATK